MFFLTRIKMKCISVISVVVQVEDKPYRLKIASHSQRIILMLVLCMQLVIKLLQHKSTPIKLGMCVI